MTKFLPIFLLLAGCVSGNQSKEQAILSIEDAHLIWKEFNIQDYDYSFRLGAGLCGSPAVKVSVRSSAVRSVKYAESGIDCYTGLPYKKGRSALMEHPNSDLLIDDIFELLFDCQEPCFAHRLVSQSQYGYPISFTLANRTIEDDSLRFELLRFSRR